MATPFTASAKDIVTGDYSGKTVIVHSNDVHGSLLNYAKIAVVAQEYEKKGAEVILVDAGDYSQGASYVNDSKGATAIEMMNAVGYDYATVGNHDFDYGFENLNKNLANAKFKVICANLLKNDKLLYNANDIYTKKSGVKIGIFGLITPQTLTFCKPDLVKGFTFLANQQLYDCATEQASQLKKNGANIVICLSHLGVSEDAIPNCSFNVYQESKGIDFIIDGHSHTKMTEGSNGEPIQSTGSQLENIGIIVIDNKTKAIESNKLIATADISDDEAVYKKADEIINQVKNKYAEIFAKTDVFLNGARMPGNRNQETNLGDLITDAMINSVVKDGNPLDVPRENIVAILNGGAIRQSINIGNITKDDIFSVLPFGNTVNVVYVSGSTLLSVLETSTQATPNEMGSFPQISGMNITIDTTKEYDKNDEPYPNTQTYGNKSINRVSINSINGRRLDPNAKYAVVTNDFLAAGGDTYYELAASDIKIDLGIPLDDATSEFINTKLNGVVGKEYENPQKRVTVLNEENHIDVTMLDAPKSAIKIGSKTKIQFRSNADINDFIEFRVNGVAIDESNYTVKAGSTIVTLNDSYISTLKAGIYEVEIVSATGVAKSQFQLVSDNKKAPSKTSPNTGVTVAGIFSLAVGISLIAVLKKKDNE